MGDMIRLRFLGSFAVRGGAQYNAGERAAFAPEIAEQALAAGVAELDEPAPHAEEMPAMPQPATQSKAPTQPPADKMIRHAPRQKGGGK